jgi:putative transposase
MSSGIYNQYTGYHNRQSIRLRGYDYSRPGAYFITVCIQDRKQKLFGDVVGGAMVENDYGKIVCQCWNDLPVHYPHIRLDEFVVMPNHVHGIVVIRASASVGAGLKPAPTNGLPEIVRALKTFSARRINEIRQTPGIPVWQRNYYDHIIRDDKSRYFIRQYIRNNPANWTADSENHLNNEIDIFDRMGTSH